MTQRYLVTGSSGFIGSRVTQLLLKDGHQIVGVDNMNDTYDVRLKKWRLGELQKQHDFRFCNIDICDKNSLRNLFQDRFDAVLNLAARAGVRQSLESPLAYFETNLTGTLNILELCKEFGVPKLVQASTSSVYGLNNSHPFQEDSTTSKPLSPYAASKKAAEVLCFSYHSLYGIDITIPRYFTVYGPAGRPDMSIFRFVQSIAENKPITIYGDGLQTRDFTYVDDIARGTIASLKSVGYEIINLGSDSPVPLLNVVKVIEKLVDNGTVNIVFEPKHPADPTATWADINKAQNILGWNPGTDIEEGVRKSVKWYTDNRGWAHKITL